MPPRVIAVEKKTGPRTSMKTMSIALLSSVTCPVTVTLPPLDPSEVGLTVALVTAGGLLAAAGAASARSSANATTTVLEPSIDALSVERRLPGQAVLVGRVGVNRRKRGS